MAPSLPNPLDVFEPESVVEDRYEIEEHLGGGGMAVVFTARDQKLHGRRVVLKSPFAGPAFQPDDLRSRFEDEIASLIRLGHVEGVVDILDQGVHEGAPFYVAQWMGGGSLQDRLAHGGRQTAGEVTAWLGPVADALDGIHKRQFVHRDVKPDNILFTEDGHARLADFGIARVFSGGTSGVTTGYTRIGTQAFWAPEQAAGLPLDGRADQFGLAATAYRALTGQPPLSHGATDPVRALAPAVPPPCEAAVHKALEPRREDRFASSRAFAEAFAAGLESAERPARTGRATRRAQKTARESAERPAEPAPDVRRRWTRPVAALVGVTLATGGLFVGGFFGGEGPLPSGPATPPVADGAPLVDTPASDLTGRWTLDLDATMGHEEMEALLLKSLAENGGNPSQLDGLKQAMAKTLAGFALELRDDGTVQALQDGVVKHAGTWEQAGDTATLTATVGSWSQVTRATLEGDQLVLRSTEGRMVLRREAPDTARAELSREQTDAAESLGLPAAFENELGMRFVLIPPGDFLMGSPASEAGRGRDETRHAVRITRAFYAQTTEVTNAQWRRYRSDHDSGATKEGVSLDGDQQPVVKVSHEDIVGPDGRGGFLGWLNDRAADRLPASMVYALPTEAQWEHAARATTTTAFSFGDTISTDQANYEGDRTLKVASFPPNRWGLHDVHGNVWEWCADWYEAERHKLTDRDDPTGPSAGTLRAVRGGSWVNNAQGLRAANRIGHPPDSRFDAFGLRVVVVPAPPR